jgi:membrane-associated phospholipid phosphatase
VSSTLFVKQHHVSDLIAGMALSAASIVFSYLILGGI